MSSREESHISYLIKFVLISHNIIYVHTPKIINQSPFTLFVFIKTFLLIYLFIWNYILYCGYITTILICLLDINYIVLSLYLLIIIDYFFTYQIYKINICINIFIMYFFLKNNMNKSQSLNKQLEKKIHWMWTKSLGIF